MGRVTRAKAAEVAEKLHVDDDAVLELPIAYLEKIDGSPEDIERTPLGEVSINSAGSKIEEDAITEKKPAKAKQGGRKSRKGKKGKDNVLDASTSSAPGVEHNGGIMPDEMELQPSPASNAASDELMKDVPEGKCA